MALAASLISAVIAVIFLMNGEQKLGALFVIITLTIQIAFGVGGSRTVDHDCQTWGLATDC